MKVQKKGFREAAAASRIRSPKRASTGMGANALTVARPPVDGA
ncbi:hypothetical protein [Polaromonas sp. AET17H-212]|nr:hypothetical protein [Polaromonas sp. AET17H-212]